MHAHCQCAALMLHFRANACSITRQLVYGNGYSRPAAPPTEVSTSGLASTMKQVRERPVSSATTTSVRSDSLKGVALERLLQLRGDGELHIGRYTKPAIVMLN